MAIVDSVTFLVAAGALAFVRVAEERPVPAEQHRWEEIDRRRAPHLAALVLRQVVLSAAIACLVIGFCESIIFAVVSQGLHRTPPFLGVILAVQGIGAVGGGVMSARSVRRFGEGPVVGVGLLMLAAGALFEIPANLPSVFAGIIIFGASLPLIIVGLMTLLQRRTPNELQGRVSSAADTLISVPQTLSIAVGAILVSHVNYRYLLVAMAVVIAGSAAYLLTRREQWVRSGGGEPFRLRAARWTRACSAWRPRRSGSFLMRRVASRQPAASCRHRSRPKRGSRVTVPSHRRRRGWPGRTARL